MKKLPKINYYIKVTLLILVSQLLTKSSIGQNEAYNNFSNNSLIYKHNAEDFKNLLKKPFLINNEEYQSEEIILIDNDSLDYYIKNKLPNGHFTILSLSRNKLEIDYIVKSGLDVELLNFGSRPGIRIWDTNGEVVKDALVYKRWKKFGYDYNNQWKAYLLKDFTQSANLKIERGGVIEEYYLKYKEPYRSRSWSNDQPSPCYDMGFVITSQPKYRHNDTLKAKAYLTNCKGKTITDSAWVELYTHGTVSRRTRSNYYSRYGRKTILKRKLGPVSNGAFLFEMVLQDSLLIDKDYHLEFTPVSNSISSSSKFRLEDYELKESVFKITPTKTTYYKTQPVQLVFEAKDKNGLALMDAEAEITIVSNKVGSVYKQNVFLPNTLFKHTYQMDESGILNITLPDSAIRFPIDQTIKIDAQLRDSEFELANKDFTVNLKNQKLSFKANVFKDSVYIEAINDFSGSVKIEQESRFKDEVVRLDLPAKFKVDLFTQSYIISTDNQEEKVYTRYIDHNVQFINYYKNNTLIVKAINPYGIELNSFAMHRGERIPIVNDSISLPIDIKEKVAVYTQFIWAGSAVEIVKDYQLYEKRLNINTNIPELIFPGKESDIEITVTDFREVPISDVNLTVVSVNDQFEKNHIPNLPYYGYEAPESELKTDQSLVKKSYSKNSLFITPYWIDKFKMSSNLYYQCLFPGANGFRYSIPLDTVDEAQVAIFVKDENTFIEPIYIELNGEPAWYQKTKLPYSLIAYEGENSVKLRFDEFSLIVDSICIDSKHKTILSIDLNDLPEFVRKEREFNSLSDHEVDVIRDNYIKIAIDKSGVNLICSEYINIFIDQFGYNPQAQWIGPLPYRNLILYRDWDDFIQFEFQSGYEHKVKDNVVIAEKHPYPKSYVKLNNNRFIGINFPLKAFNHKQKESFLKEPKYKISDMILLDYEDDILPYIHESSIQISTPFNEAFATAIYPLGNKKEVKFYRGMITDFKSVPKGKYSIHYYYEDFLIKTPLIEVIPNAKTLFKVNREYLMSNDYKDEIETLYGYSDSSAPKSSYTVEYPRLDTKDKSNIIAGVITDENNEPVPFASIVIEQNGDLIAGGTSDFDGYFSIKVPIGVYDLRASYLGYSTSLIKGIKVRYGKIAEVFIEMEPQSQVLAEVAVVSYRIPLIDRDATSTSANTISSSAISTLPTRNVRSIASRSAGVYSEDKNSGLNLKGARTSETDIYIDGIKVRGGTNLPANAIEQLTLETGGVPAGYGNATGGVILLEDKEDKYEELSMEMSGLRSNFSDNAIWEPNLLTDTTGTANFKVNWPDDITRWKTAILAVGDDLKAGQKMTLTKSFKPLQASLSLPRFLTEGDSAMVVSKIMNYTGYDYKMNISFSSLNFNKSIDTTVGSNAVWYFPITSGNADTLASTFKATLPNGYIDGEERVIPIVKSGIKRHEGKFYSISKDTIIPIVPKDKSNNLHLNIYTSIHEIMLEEINFLRVYLHKCNEQMSSKLKALLISKYIDEENWSRKKEQEVKKLIRLLEKNQSDDGGWSWWGKGFSNSFMTLLVGEALHMAKEADYKVSALYHLSSNIETVLLKDHVNKIEILYLAAILDKNLDYKTNIYKIEREEKLSTRDKILLLRIKQMRSIQHNPYECFIYSGKTLFGNIYFGEKSFFNVRQSSIYLSSICYQILKDGGIGKDTLNKVMNYMLEERIGNQSMNTLFSSQMLKLLYSEYKSRKELEPEITLSYNQNEIPIDTLPYLGDFSPKDANNLKVKVKTKTPVYIGWHQSFFEKLPKPKSKYFKVNTTISQNGNETDSLIKGEKTTLNVSVNAKYKSNYLMLEVPIPAGCSAELNGWYSNISHKENFRDKVVFYIKNLQKGLHNYTIELTPRYSGRYNINPAHITNMYFPLFEGYNQIKKVEIGN